MPKISSVLLYWEANIFTSDNGVLVLLFSENNVCTWPSKIRFSIAILRFLVSERSPEKNCTKIITDKRQNKLSEPKGWSLLHSQIRAIFPHKRWVVSMELKCHEIMRKQRYQHLKALFIHYMQFPCSSVAHVSDTKNDTPIHLAQF